MLLSGNVPPASHMDSEADISRNERKDVRSRHLTSTLSRHVLSPWERQERPISGYKGKEGHATQMS